MQIPIGEEVSPASVLVQTVQKGIECSRFVRWLVADKLILFAHK